MTAKAANNGTGTAPPASKTSFPKVDQMHSKVSWASQLAMSFSPGETKTPRCTSSILSRAAKDTSTSFSLQSSFSDSLSLMTPVAKALMAFGAAVVIVLILCCRFQCSVLGAPRLVMVVPNSGF